MQNNATLCIYDLTLSNFRNYESVRLCTSGRSVVVAGENGAGKTNILEALSLLTPGRGLRLAKLTDLSRIPYSRSWGISVTAHTMAGQSTIGTGQSKDRDKRRSVRIDGTNTTQTELGRYLSCVWLTPQMDRLFNGGTTAKRRFLDRLILGFDHKHASRTHGYEKALYARSTLLKNTAKRDEDWLGAIEEEIAQRGVAIAAARLLMIERLNEITCDGFYPFTGAMLHINGTVENWLKKYNANETEDMFKCTLKEGRKRDAITGGSHTGIHKTDITVKHLGKNMDASLCSTGEQKTLLLSIVLGNLKLQKAETGYMPLLLLDDIVAHLDQKKYEAVFDAVHTLQPQVWYTGTHMANFSPLPKNYNRFTIANNTVHFYT